MVMYLFGVTGSILGNLRSKHKYAPEQPRPSFPMASAILSYIGIMEGKMETRGIVEVI